MEQNYNSQQSYTQSGSYNQQSQGYNFDPMTGEYIGQGVPPVAPVPPEMQPVVPQMGMKWFKFIIYFQLVFNAVMHLVNAFTYFTGGHYGADPQLIYDYYGMGLRYCDVFVALFCVAMAVYAYVVRFLLSRYKSCAPVMYYMIWILAPLHVIVYQVLSTAVTGEANIDILLWVKQIVPNIIPLIIHIVYFQKRKHLFNNPIGKKEATINVVSVTLFALQVLSLVGVIVGGGFTNLNPFFLIGFFLPTIVGILLQVITYNLRQKERLMRTNPY